MKSIRLKVCYYISFFAMIMAITILLPATVKADGHTAQPITEIKGGVMFKAAIDDKKSKVFTIDGYIANLRISNRSTSGYAITTVSPKDGQTYFLDFYMMDLADPTKDWKGCPNEEQFGYKWTKVSKVTNGFYSGCDEFKFVETDKPGYYYIVFNHDEYALSYNAKKSKFDALRLYEPEDNVIPLYLYEAPKSLEPEIVPENLKELSKGKFKKSIFGKKVTLNYANDEITTVSMDKVNVYGVYINEAGKQAKIYKIKEGASFDKYNILRIEINGTFYDVPLSDKIVLKPYKGFNSISSKKSKSVTLKWDQVNGAMSYVIASKPATEKGNGKTVTIRGKNTKSYTLTLSKGGIDYVFRIKALDKNGKVLEDWTEWSKKVSVKK